MATTKKTVSKKKLIDDDHIISKYMALICLSHSCHWLQAKNNEVGGVSNIKTHKLCLAISQSFSRFLKCKTPQQLRISEIKKCKTRL